MSDDASSYEHNHSHHIHESHAVTKVLQAAGQRFQRIEIRFV